MSFLSIFQPEREEIDADLKSLFTNWRHHIRYRAPAVSCSSPQQQIQALSAAGTQVTFKWMPLNEESRPEVSMFINSVFELVVQSLELDVLAKALELIRQLILLPWCRIDHNSNNNIELWRKVMSTFGKCLKTRQESTPEERNVANILHDILCDSRCYQFIFDNLVPYCTPRELHGIVQVLLDASQSRDLPSGVLFDWVCEFLLRFRNQIPVGLHQHQDRRSVRPRRRLPDEEDATKLLKKILEISDLSSSEFIEELRGIHRDAFLTAASLLCTSQENLTILADGGLAVLS